MKRVFLIFLGGMIVFFLLFSLFGKGDEYIAEKTLWKINYQFKEITKDPGVYPAGTYEKIVKKYENFFKKHSNSSLVPIAHLSLGRVYIVQKKYEKAREVFENTYTLYSDQPKIALKALIDIEKIYRLEEDFENSLRIFDKIIKEYPLTEVGLKTPLLIAQSYVEQNNLVEAQKSFKEAIVYYKRIISENPQTGIEFVTMQLVATCYISQQRWEEAVNIFGEILLKYPDLRVLNLKTVNKIVKFINTISVTKLKDLKLPVKFYTEFITKYPQHPYNTKFKEIISSLQSLKNYKDSEKSKSELTVP